MAQGKKSDREQQLTLLNDDINVTRAPNASEIRRQFLRLEACLKKPELLTGENDKDFDNLFDEFLRSVIPTDAIEYVLVRDVVILTFDINRLQRHKILLVKAAQPGAVNALISPGVKDRYEASRISDKWAIGDEAAKSQVDEILNMRGMKPGSINAKAIEIRLDQLQKLEGMIFNLESRRFRILREIDRRRDGFKKRLQEAIKNTDGSYSVVDAASRSWPVSDPSPATSAARSKDVTEDDETGASRKNIS